MTMTPMNHLGNMSDTVVLPVWGRCLVKPDDIMESDPQYAAARKAGLVIVDQRVEREQFAQMEATLVAVGGNCFETWKGPRPQVGQKVLIDKYSGCTVNVDGMQHRLINDTDIIAIIDRVSDK